MVSTCAFHSAAIASAITAFGRNDMAAGRRADRLAVERDGKTAIRLGDAGAGIKSLALWHAGRAPHRLFRIERRLAGDFVE